MSAELDRFFASLPEVARGRLPTTPAGLIAFRFVSEDGPSTWFVTLDGGRVRVDRHGHDPDCVVETRPDTFERLVAGADHTLAMLFRGVVSVEGDLPLFLVFRRLLPIRADSAGSVAAEPTAEILPGGGHDGIGLHDTTGIFYGNMFMISNRNGDVETEPVTPLGLFFLDTRFLSTWRLSLDGEKLTELSIEDVCSFESRFALVPGQPTYYVQATTSILRHRSVGETFEEAVTLINYAAEPVRYAVRLDVGADFAEVQEIRDGLRRAREVSTTIDDSSLRLHYRRRTLHRETVVSASEPARVDERGFTFTVSVDSHSTWTVRLRVLTLVRDLSRRDLRERLRSSTHRSRAEAGREIDQIAAAVPELRAEHGPLSEAYRRSVLDLAALYHQGLNYRDRLPATGLPWSMTLLGRESLVSSLQVLPFLPHRAVSTLRILALSQGARIDPFRGEQPGRIVQESRYGESAAFADTPDAADYSAADTTPLFVILLDEYERWTGDAELVRRYEFEARAAIAWLDEYADPVGDGYVWSTRRQRPGGLVNESWRNSVESICFRDGRLATFPQAICELQGYAYDARLRAARMARLFWNDPAYADRLERAAAALRDRFNRDFWLPERGYYALALQSDGQRVDALASNVGHLLWSGIVEPEHAERLAGHLLGPALFSGWGVRTLASTEGQYNPLGHHTGAIWPADNSLIVWGLRRYGFRQEAARIARALLEAGQHFQGALPAYFAGYDRATTRVPVPHHATDSPYAPSAGAPLLLLRALLGLEPREDHLVIDAGVPEDMGHIELLDIRGRWGYIDALGRGRPFRDQPRA
ncbi:amylo-alpha-1,6-glucosidase [Micromonospora sp. KC207]|uniref:glycogen debranching N-terminal domain-containing protein n=1 Tax=Micromonospora sp. KC207 TaxID=2530377 RepID=UPI001043ECE0|nr:glycogen debranching N-terminal domain-containing protein [Micromonospora sp. KC207]TDC64099.1 amylo-alpha-1,6-glucosidase [Micromonospora sp. KC207]